MTGDIIGEYSFAKPLATGDRIVFGDMMQYSFVKNTTFNGTPLPDIAILEEDGSYRVVREALPMTTSGRELAEASRKQTQARRLHMAGQKPTPRG